MALDMNLLAEIYFAFDKPVEYRLKCGQTLWITPIKVADEPVFNSSYKILDIDKNASSDVEDISMSYLKYLIVKKMGEEACRQQFVNICIFCWGLKMPYLTTDENGKHCLCNLGEDGKEQLRITAKEFDEIKRITLYQNILDYDDEYINPDLKQSMAEVDALRSKDISSPNLERRMAIIMAHSGLSKSAQLEMTMRSHKMLFQEIVGEIEYSAARPIAIFAGKANEVQWIFKPKKGKFDDYITSVEDYNKSMGGDGRVKPTAQFSEDFASQLKNFEEEK